MTTKTVDVREAQDHLSELLSEVAEGIQVILVEGNTPLARLLPVEPTALGPRIPGLHPGAAQISEDFDAPLPEDLWTSGTP